MLDLTLGPSFKVKQWFTGFGELSVRWIQICIGLRCVGLVISEYCFTPFTDIRVFNGGLHW